MRDEEEEEEEEEEEMRIEMDLTYFKRKIKSKLTSPTGQRCVLTVSLRGAKFALIVLDRRMNRLS